MIDKETDELALKKVKTKRQRGSVLIPSYITDEVQTDTDSIRVPMIMHGDNPG
jgi:hypothetical protein